MKKSLMILSAAFLLPLGFAVAGSDCGKCDKTKTVAKTECSKTECDKAATVAKKDCDKGDCDKATTVATECNYKCEKSVAKLFTSYDKDKDGKLSKDEFMALVKATMAKQPEAKADKTTAAN